ncbi:unnamed protein product, partial [Aphanomyces euteiches]
ESIRRRCHASSSDQLSRRPRCVWRTDILQFPLQDTHDPKEAQHERSQIPSSPVLHPDRGGPVHHLVVCRWHVHPIVQRPTIGKRDLAQ